MLSRARLLICRVPCQRRRRPGSSQRNPPERLQHFAPCDVATSHPAMSQLRTLRCRNFAPCDVSTSHPAKFVRRLGVPAHRLAGSVRGPHASVSRSLAMMDLPFSPSFSLFSMLSPEFHHNSTRKERGQTRLLHLPNERRRQRVTTLNIRTPYTAAQRSDPNAFKT